MAHPLGSSTALAFSLTLLTMCFGCDTGDPDAGADARPFADAGLDAASDPDGGPPGGADIGPVEPDMTSVGPDAERLTDAGSDEGPAGPADAGLDAVSDPDGGPPDSADVGPVEPDMTPVGPDAAPPDLCGDSVVDDGEACDLGEDNGAGLGCGLDCRREGVCGDGALQPLFEDCDEGDTQPDGFCDAECGAIERIDPPEAFWPEGARVRLTADYTPPGDLRVSAGATITLDATWSLSQSVVRLEGRADVPVVLTPGEQGLCRTTLVEVNGGTLSASHTVFEQGSTAVRGELGRVELRDVTVRDLCGVDGGVVGVILTRRVEGLLERVAVHDLTVTAVGRDGADEADGRRPFEGFPGPGVAGVVVDSTGAVSVNGLDIRGLAAGAGGRGGEGIEQASAAGGAGGSAVGLLANGFATLSDVRIGDLRAGRGGPGGPGGGAGGPGGNAVGVDTAFVGRGAPPTLVASGFEVSGLRSGNGGPGGDGRPGAPGEPGGPGGDGGRPGSVSGVSHEMAYTLRLTNALLYGLSLGHFGRGGMGGPGGAGAGGGDGGSVAPLMPGPILAGIRSRERIDLEHVTVVIDHLPEPLGQTAPGGLPGEGSDAAGVDVTPEPEPSVYGIQVLAVSPPLRNSIVVGGEGPAPPWQATVGVEVSNDVGFMARDILLWGFDTPLVDVDGRDLVEGDPLFVDRDGGDLRPDHDSPAVGRARDSGAPIDLQGRPRPAPAALGALEPAPAP